MEVTPPARPPFELSVTFPWKRTRLAKDFAEKSKRFQRGGIGGERASYEATRWARGGANLLRASPLRFSEATEEVAQEFSTPVAEHTAIHLGAMIEADVTRDSVERVAGACLRIGGAV